MGRGYTVDTRQVAFDRFQRVVEHNPIAHTRKLSLMEQEKLARENLAKQKEHDNKRQAEKDFENDNRIILDSPYSTAASRKINTKLYGK